MVGIVPPSVPTPCSEMSEGDISGETREKLSLSEVKYSEGKGDIDEFRL